MGPDHNECMSCGRSDLTDKDQLLTAANVQKIIQGALDACNEVMTEFMGKKRAAKWDIINQGLYDAEQLNAKLSERLKLVGLTPAPSRSKR